MEKLNSSDLMIGNYLQKDGIIHQVIAISGNITDSKKGIKKAATIRTDKSSEYIFLDHFEPILLTKSIVKKVGFIKLTQNEYIIEDFQKYILNINESGGFDLIHYNKNKDIGIKICEIKYLHLLQNILKCNHNFVLKLKK